MTLQTIIIGGGISGITAAVELAEAGREVVLLEKEAYLGGHVSQFSSYFPKLCPPSCGLEINYRRIRSNPRITYYTGAELESIDGVDGDFSLKVALKPGMISNSCTSCGLCAEVCPEERPLKPGRTKGEKAAYINNGLSFPAKYSIDPDVCKKEACAKCLEVCDFDAIRLDALAGGMELKAGKIILALGWTPYDASKIENYSYSQEADIVTNIEFERIMAACGRENKKLTRPSDGKRPQRVAFVQCAGSRDENHLPYCSAVCCPASVKHALSLAKSDPDITSEIFYIDLRLTGRNEKLLNRAEESPSVTLTKGKVGRLEHGDGGVFLEVEDILAGRKRKEMFDMVVLATGMVASKAPKGCSLNEAGFLQAIQRAGIYPASSCKRPMDVSTSVKDATATALKTMKHE